MRQDIDQLMEARGIDAILVLGSGQHNPYMVYLMGGAHLTRAYLVKKRGEDGLLFYRSMERDEAAKSALECRSVDEFRPDKLLEKAAGDQVKASSALLKRILESAGVTSGRVSLYGQSDAGEAFSVFSSLQGLMPQVEFQGELGDSTLLAAMETKEEREVERIRKMGQAATRVIGKAADFLSSRKTQGDTLLNTDGEPLTIGEVKRRINLWLAEEGGENPHGTIFAQGHDAGVPHSTGNNNEVLYLGKTIVFDFFPCEAGGGYFYDITRTWSLGYATDEAWKLYEDVKTAYEALFAELRAGKPLKVFQQKTCEIFQQQGHPTIMDSPLTREGFVHSLGHGVGLHIHERPFFRLSLAETELLKPRSVITLEPGLYYPEKNMGVRLEDTLWIRPDGTPEILADFPKDLVLPVK